MRYIDVTEFGEPNVMQLAQTFPLAEAAAAHRLIESSTHIGKIIPLVRNA